MVQIAFFSGEIIRELEESFKRDERLRTDEESRREAESYNLTNKKIARFTIFTWIILWFQLTRFSNVFFLWKKELKLRWNHHVRDVISYVIVFICQFRSKHCLTYILQGRTVIRYWEEVFKKYRVLRRCHSVFIWSLLNMKPDFLSAGILLWLSCLFICVK